MRHLAYVCADSGIPLSGTKGSSIHVRSMAEAFAALDVRLSLLSPRSEGASWARRSGIELLPVDRGRDVGQALDRIHAVTPLDAVYERLSLSAEEASRWCRFHRVPHILEVNAPLADEAAEHRGLENPDTAREIERRVIRHASLLLPVSPWLGRWLAAAGVEDKRIRVLPNGVNDSLLAAPEEGATTWGAVTLTCVGFVGSLRPWHDIDTLLDAIALLPEESYTLWIVGDGPGGDRLRARLKDPALASRVAWGGALPVERVPDVIDGMDLCVAPHPAGGEFYFCPIKILEYGARSRPVIAAGRPELREQFPEGSLAWYCPGDAADLARRIEELAADRQRSAMLGRRLREFAGVHTWRTHAASVLEWAGLGTVPEAAGVRR